MKTSSVIKILVIVAAAVLPSIAHAQFGFGRAPRPINIQGRGEGALNRETQTYIESMRRMQVPEIPTGPNCSTDFSSGDDGVFSRIMYCHRANPVAASGFLQLGYDVPADFLKGYSEIDTVSWWALGPAAPSSDLYRKSGFKLEMPVELLTMLNVSAAATWEKILSCNLGDSNRAREMYRSANFAGCAKENEIKSALLELRSNLPVLAASIEPVIFMNPMQIEREAVRTLNQRSSLEQAIRLREFTNRQATFVNEVLRNGAVAEIQTPETLARDGNEAVQLIQLRAREQALWSLQRESITHSAAEMFDGLLPKAPRTHPLFQQILIEEQLAIIDPNQAPRRMTQEYANNASKRVYMNQLAMWINSIENRKCAAFGLWPSASRAALAAVADFAVRAANPRGSTSGRRLFVQMDCPTEYAAHGLRLNDIYTVGATNIWNEYRAIRSLYISGGRP